MKLKYLDYLDWYDGPQVIQLEDDDKKVYLGFIYDITPKPNMSPVWVFLVFKTETYPQGKTYGDIKSLAVGVIEFIGWDDITLTERPLTDDELNHWNDDFKLSDQ